MFLYFSKIIVSSLASSVDDLGNFLGTPRPTSAQHEYVPCNSPGTLSISAEQLPTIESAFRLKYLHGIRM